MTLRARLVLISGIASVALTAACASRAPRSETDAEHLAHSKLPEAQHAAIHAKMHGGASGDSSFAQMQKRGGVAMGVDQYSSKHVFETSPTGGRISLQRDTGDSLGVAQIRAHMKLIQHAFASGDFTTPAFVHARDMPGTSVMTEKREAIFYTYADLPRGGQVIIRTSDPAAIKAIAEFLQAQRTEHH